MTFFLYFAFVGIFVIIGLVFVLSPRWVRAGAALVVLPLCTWGAYHFGRAWEQLYCLGTYVRCFERYSTALARLALQKKQKELQDVVVYFDENWKLDLQSRDKIEFLVCEIEAMANGAKANEVSPEKENTK